jgi:hypothetical protein
LTGSPIDSILFLSSVPDWLVSLPTGCLFCVV